MVSGQVQNPLDTLSRYQILKRYAPIFHMGVNSKKPYYEGQDLIVAVDQDKNWGTYDDDEDVWAEDSYWQRTTIAQKLSQIDSEINDITPVVYTSFLELEEAYVLCYELYHTYNEVNPGTLFDHMGDIEGVTMIVSKTGQILGASSTAHSHKIWSTPHKSKNRPGIIHRHHKKTYALKLSGTHAHFWVGANGPIDLLYGSRGHAIYPYAKKQSKTGITYSVASNGVSKAPKVIGERQKDRGYTEKANYLLVAEEELLVKNVGSKALDKMYHIGQSMGTWSGRLWGNGYYGYIDDGPRERYNMTYDTPLDTNWKFNPRKNIGNSSTLLVARDNGLNLKTQIASFYRSGAVIQGGGALSKEVQATSPLYFYHTPTPKEVLSIEAKVLRVGKLHLKNGWFSNSFNEAYVNETGPNAGLMLRSALSSDNAYVYVGWAPEKEEIILVTKRTDEPAHIQRFNKFAEGYKYFRIQKNNDIITIQIRQAHKKEWHSLLQLKSDDVFQNEKKVYGCLLVLSDVNSLEPFYYTNAEFEQIKINYNIR